MTELKDDLPSIKSDQTQVCNKCDACPPIKNVTHPLRYYEFTQEELKALDECDRESFYRRCLPISTTLAALTYTAIKRGFLKGHPIFGIWPKVMFAILVGHCLGRIVYTPQYDATLLDKLPPDSFLVKTIKKNKEVQKQ